jgi:hypothetical protein
VLPSLAHAAGFPRADSGYHDYAELTAQVRETAAAHPGIVRRLSLGRSYEGRSLWAVKISDNAAIDAAEPEVLLTAGLHGREHLTVEMALYMLDELTARYGDDERIRAAVDGREIWIVFNANPDGAEYDLATGRYRGWRKNRQRRAGSSAVGIDLNRNWSWKWGCCKGSSAKPRSPEYRGPAAFSAPETRALRDFVASRVVGGHQQIRAAIDFHTFSELVLWPYGYTRADTASRLGREDRATFATLGRRMAESSRYKPQQTSDLYIADGTMIDWLWARHRVFAYTFELYPPASRPDFYPPDEVIAAETARNREAVLMLLEHADCPQRAIGKAARYCPTPLGRAATVFVDDFRAASARAAGGGLIATPNATIR